MAAPQERTLALPWGTLSALSFGDPSGVPVLGLHGWQDNAATFEGLAPHLEGVHLVALDLPGHGRSSWRPSGMDYGFLSWVVDAFHAADALGWETFGLLGHSMGAGIASLMAGTLPERVDRMVLLEGLGPLSNRAEDAPGQLAEAMLAEARHGSVGERVFESLEDAAERRQAAAGILSDASARTLMTRGTVPVEGGVRWCPDPRIRAASRIRLTEAQTLAFLRQITAPTLLVRALQGWPFERERMADRIECIQHRSRLEVEGGHHVHLDAPERVAAAVRALLVSGSLPGASG
jgi:pimeloyl-ACP methyl ester carboxylesterase